MNTRRSAPVPWLARARAIAQKVGLDPRYLRRLRWMLKAQSVRRNGASLARHWRFVISSPEPHNFTFEIANLDELAQWAGAVAGCDPELAAALIAEPTDDQLLAQRLRSATEGRWWWSKPEPQFGKRLGWYALTRILRPRLTIEVGVHDGLGSLLLLRALERNQEGGHGGELVSLDVNPAAGWLVGSHPLWELRIQSSEAGLPAVLRGERELDLFIYDGWHSYQAERGDLEVALDHLGRGGVLVSDDSQISRALPELCRDHGLDLFEFREVPVEHFHPGSVLAAARGPAAEEPMGGGLRG